MYKNVVHFLWKTESKFCNILKYKKIIGRHRGGCQRPKGYKKHSFYEWHLFKAIRKSCVIIECYKFIVLPDFPKKTLCACLDAVPPEIFIRTCSFGWLSSLPGFACAESVQIVGPLLHHPSALRQVLRIIVRCAYLIPFAMRKLAFNPVPIIAQFVKQR